MGGAAGVAVEIEIIGERVAMSKTLASTNVTATTLDSRRSPRRIATQ